MNTKTLSLAIILLGLGGNSLSAEDKVPAAPNGIEIPANYKDWQLIGISHREDNGSLRAILGNPTAVAAARQGKTNPWPDGSILTKLVWKDSVHPNWEQATVPGEFLQAEFMIKDANKYQATGGWGFARWLGAGQKPYGKDASFVQECYACHLPMKNKDYVFTKPVALP